MKKKHFRFLSFISFLIGTFFLLNSKTGIVGAVIGVSNISSGFGSIFGIIFILISLSLLLIQNITSIDYLVEDIHEIIDEQKSKYKANPRFVRGLKEIEKSVDNDKENYYRISGKKEYGLRKNIAKRLKRRKQSLKRRERDFFQIPQHVKHDPETHETTIIDLPDNGLYEYIPMGGKKSKFVELKVIHYTDDKGKKGIEQDFKNKKNIFLQDTHFGAFFVSKPLPERLKLSKARQILGIGKQTFAGKKRPRIPKYELTTKVKVRKERVLVKNSYYNKESGGEITPNEYRKLKEEQKQKYFPVQKYAIAGGISNRDISGGIKARRYQHKDIDKETDKKRHKIEKWKKST